MSHAVPARAVRLTAVLLLAGLGACRVVEAKVANLDALHAEGGRHVYHAALEGDVEYFLRHEVAGLLRGAGARVAAKSPGPVPDPASECLENLIELADFDGQDPSLSSRQVEWFARLAVEDPSRLSRERCVLALGRAGARLRAGLPAALEAGREAVGPQALASALSGLVGSYRRLIESTSATRSTAELDLAAACDLVRGLALDLDGARRALRVSADLVRSAGRTRPDVEPLRSLARELEAVAVRRALAAALEDSDPWVRAAAVEGGVEASGGALLARLLDELPGEDEPQVVARILRLVERNGLPLDASAEAAAPSAAERAAREQRWLAALYARLEESADGEVQVAAMLALARASGRRDASLREEDWQEWWLGRQAASPAGRDPSGAGRGT